MRPALSRGSRYTRHGFFEAVAEELWERSHAQRGAVAAVVKTFAPVIEAARRRGYSPAHVVSIMQRVGEHGTSRLANRLRCG